MFNVTSTQVAEEQSLFTDTEQRALSISSIIVNTISLLSCLFIILCWILFKPLRKLSYGFVFYMAIATSLRSISKMFGGNHNSGDIMCSIQGFLITYGGLSTFYWILSVALIMYTIIFFPLKWSNNPNRSTKCNKISLIINFGLPLIFAALPLFASDYISTGGWCWIDGKSVEGKALRWITYYGQLVLILIFCIFAYCRIYIYLEFNPKSPDVKNIHKLYNRIKLYPLCLILGFTVAVIRRFVGLWDISLGFGWNMAQSISTGLFGFMLLIVYGRLGKLNKLFRNKYPLCCNPICDHLCCCLHSTHLQNNQNECKDVANTTTNTNGKTDLEIIHNDQNTTAIHTNLKVINIQMSASTQNVLKESRDVFNAKHQQDQS